MKFWKSQHFKALQKAWYKRLEAAGFHDAEEVVAGEHVLKQAAAHPYRGTDELARDSKAAYFNFVSQMVQETVFTSDVDRLILVLHADGKKIRHICDELEAMGQARCRGTVRYKIRIYEMKWGLRTYSAKQLNRKTS